MSASLNGENRVSEMIIVDTDILIDAGRGISEAISCLEQKISVITFTKVFRCQVSSLRSVELWLGKQVSATEADPLCRSRF